MVIPEQTLNIMRFICGGMTLAGFFIMFYNVIAYFRLARRLEEQSYTHAFTSKKVTLQSQALMILFLFGYLVGTMDLFFRRVEPIYMFVALIFFLGSFYVSILLKAQLNMLQSLRAKTAELMTGYVNSIEMKDAYTNGHSRHVYDLVNLFCDYLPPEILARIDKPKLLDAALLHDIGKMSLGDNILHKKGPLTDEEWAIVKTHTVNGRKMLEGTCFVEIGDWVLYHHERIDGLGYHGLVGEEIPLEARIISVADTYSALATDRAYRARLSYDQIRLIMEKVAGSQLDRNLTSIFLSIPQSRLEALKLYKAS